MKLNEYCSESEPPSRGKLSHFLANQLKAVTESNFSFFDVKCSVNNLMHHHTIDNFIEF